MAVLKKIGMMSFAKIYSLLLMVAGLVEGTILTFTYAFNPQSLARSPMLMQIGYAGILVFPIAYAIVGFVIGIVVSWFFNLFAGMVGGVEIELDSELKRKHKE